MIDSPQVSRTRRSCSNSQR